MSEEEEGERESTRERKKERGRGRREREHARERGKKRKERGSVRERGRRERGTDACWLAIHHWLVTLCCAERKLTSLLIS